MAIATLQVEVYINNLEVTPSAIQVPVEGGTFKAMSDFVDTFKIDPNHDSWIISNQGKSDLDLTKMEYRFRVDPNPLSVNRKSEIVIADEFNSSMTARVEITQEPSKVEIVNKDIFSNFTVGPAGSTEFEFEVIHTYPDIAVVLDNSGYLWNYTVTKHPTEPNKSTVTVIIGNNESFTQTVGLNLTVQSRVPSNLTNIAKDQVYITLPVKEYESIEGFVEIQPIITDAQGNPINNVPRNIPAFDFSLNESGRYFPPSTSLTQTIVVKQANGDPLTDRNKVSLRVSNNKDWISTSINADGNVVVTLKANTADESRRRRGKVTIKSVEYVERYPWLSPTNLRGTPKINAIDPTDNSQLKVLVGNVGSGIYTVPADSGLKPENYDNRKVRAIKFDGDKNLRVYNPLEDSDISNYQGSEVYQFKNKIRIPFVITGVKSTAKIIPNQDGRIGFLIDENNITFEGNNYRILSWELKNTYIQGNYYDADGNLANKVGESNPMAIFNEAISYKQTKMIGFKYELRLLKIG